jgi:hypothetical protein
MPSGILAEINMNISGDLLSLFARGLSGDDFDTFHNQSEYGNDSWARFWKLFREQ